MKRFKLTAAIVALALALAGGPACACSILLVGAGASADGSMFVARAVDSSSVVPSILVRHPAPVAGTKYRSSDDPGARTFEYVFPDGTMAYTAAPDADSLRWACCGFNEAGLGMSAAVSLFASLEVQKLDPYLPDGISERDVPDVILPTARTAKEGVRLLGRLIEKHGAAEGFGVGFVDGKEVWYLETGGAHRWLAQRLPKDKYLASANLGRLRQYDPASPDFLASPGLVQWAREHGFYDPDRDGAFDFRKAYMLDHEIDRTYSYPRVWQMQKLLTPSLGQNVTAGGDFPLFAVPDRKVTLEDVKAILRNHYGSGELAGHDPYSRGLRGDEPYRPLSVFRAQNTHVLQVRPSLPQEIGRITWFAPGMSDLSVYVPFYHGLKAFPEAWAQAGIEADDQSAFWKLRKLQTLVMSDYPNLAPVVKASFAAFEAETKKKCEAFEARYLKARAGDPAAAARMLEDFNTGIAAEALTVADRLTNRIFFLRAKAIEATVPFRYTRPH